MPNIKLSHLGNKCSTSYLLFEYLIRVSRRFMIAQQTIKTSRHFCVHCLNKKYGNNRKSHTKRWIAQNSSIHTHMHTSHTNSQTLLIGSSLFYITKLNYHCEWFAHSCFNIAGLERVSIEEALTFCLVVSLMYRSNFPFSSLYRDHTS